MTSDVFLPGALSGVPLADLTTLHVGGPSTQLYDAESEEEFIDAIRSVDEAGQALLVLGGGSNVLVDDAGFDGVVVRDRRCRIEVTDQAACFGTQLTVAAGTRWDDVVIRAVEGGWAGVESLAGIPGSTGATPVQNVGAYGQEVSDTLASIRTWDRSENRIRMFAVGELDFAYRSSMLKRMMIGATPRYVVLDVTFQLRIGDLSEPLRYKELAGRLEVEEGARVPLAEVREAVLELRTSKGMVLNAADHDTWSAGSFFTNPILSADDAVKLPEDAPRFPADGGRVKTSAAWLIQHAGFDKGFGIPGPAALSTKHALALTNRGGATAEDLLTIAREVRDGVRERFGVTLVNEPILVGCEL